MKGKIKRKCGEGINTASAASIKRNNGSILRRIRHCDVMWKNTFEIVSEFAKSPVASLASRDGEAKAGLARVGPSLSENMMCKKRI